MAASNDAGVNGKLSLGGICTLIMGAFFLLGNFLPSDSLVMVLVKLGGLAVLAFLSASGWFAAGSIYGSANSVSGVFWIIFGSGNVLLLVAALAGVPILALIGAIAMGLGLVLGGILGGVGLMGGQARGSAGPLKPIAGIVLLVAGIASVWVLLMGFGVALPLGGVMAMVSGYGTAAGLVLAGLTMMMSKA